MICQKQEIEMHISDGVLSTQVLIAGGVLTAAGTAIGLKKMDYDKIPKVGLMASAFFVASLIHVPLGPSNVHLILNGLIGIILGWAAFPAILVALLLQALLFQFGGITVLGVNTFNMAFPSVIVYLLFYKAVMSKKSWVFITASFFTGFIAVFLAGIFTSLSLVFTGEAFIRVAKLIIIAHIPIMFIEGLITILVVGFLKKVKPEILEINGTLISKKVREEALKT